MKKQKKVYSFFRYEGYPFYARKEIPYEFGLQAQLILDEICFNWNKQQLLNKIHQSFETSNRDAFLSLSEEYKQFIWE